MARAVATATAARKPLLVAGPKLAIEAGEVKRLPYVKVGEWNFRDRYGPIEVTTDDLDTIVRNFKRDARRQDIPLLVNEEHGVPPDGADLSSYVGPGAVGWIKDLEREGDMVWAHVDPNELGTSLLAGDRYRNTSPELILDWIDPETDESFGMTAAGLALTTAPRMKQLGVRGMPLAAGETRPERARVLAFAEMADVHVDSANPEISVAYAYPDDKRLPLNTAAGVKGAMARFMTIKASTKDRSQAWARVTAAGQKLHVVVPQSWEQLDATECAQWLMAEGDGESELLELPICAYQPPASSFGRCPGFTRAVDDGDKDNDVCMMAARGCNGYVPWPGDTQHGAVDDQFQAPGTAEGWATSVLPDNPAYYSEGGRMGKEVVDPAKPGAVTPPAAEPVTPPAAAAAAAATAPPAAADSKLAVADMAEAERIINAERTERKKLEARVEAAENTANNAKQALVDRDTADKLGKAGASLAELVQSGRITPAEAEVYTANLATFAEQDFLLTALKARPANSAIPMGEKGKGGERPQGSSDSQALDAMAKAYMTELKQPIVVSDKNFGKNYKEALIAVSKVGFQGG